MLALTNSETSTILIVALVVVVLVIAAMAIAQRKRSASLQERFGPEYERTLRQTGSKPKAEHELTRREERVKRMHIGELPPSAKSRYTEEWRTVQTHFVDDPKGALVRADRVISDVMRPIIQA